jgi:hypothetical protein
MKPFYTLSLFLTTTLAAIPVVTTAQARRTTTSRAGGAPASATTGEDDLLRQPVQIDDRFESSLDTGCTYELTIRGTVRPVRENTGANATTQRLRPDLRVAATVRCPQSTESHIQERRVYSTGVTREELERLVELNGTVHRMQNSGRCLYVPRISFLTSGFTASEVGYLCPRSSSPVRGGAVRASTR